MPRYKLNVPTAGDYLYSDGYTDSAVVADTIDEARELLESFEVHSYIGCCRVVYAADVENGDCHEDAEPGDTTVDYCADDGREELEPHQCRVWMTGPPTFWWQLEPLPPDPIHPSEVPIGCSIHVDGRGSTRTTTEPWEADGRWLTEVAVWPDGRQRFEICLTLDSVHILPTGSWPEVRYRLTVEGEVAEGSKDEMEWLRGWAIEAREDQWRRELPPVSAELAGSTLVDDHARGSG